MPLNALYDLPAPAKLNSFLHVVGRRADGYHLLQSAFVLIDWADRLSFECRNDGLLQRHDLGPRLPADDLCLRAARALQQASGCALGVDIHIDKQLPWGAGMGGGSSDAATTLLALNRLWGLGWPRERLLAMAQTLGADVPFFIGGHNAFVEGIGERLKPIPWPQQGYAVIKPAAAIATADIFGDPALVRDTPAAILLGSFEETAENALGRNDGNVVKAVSVADLVQGWGHNDLEPPARRHCPEVAQASQRLEALFGNSRMTGSGSAVFARVGTNAPPEATFPAESLPPGWVGRMCRSLEQHPLVGWAS